MRVHNARTVTVNATPPWLLTLFVQGTLGDARRVLSGLNLAWLPRLEESTLSRRDQLTPHAYFNSRGKG